MVAWEKYKELSRERGSLAMELFVVVSTPVKSSEDIKMILPEHLTYLAEQEAAGILALAGPVADYSGAEMRGEGLLVYRADTLAAAKEIAENDPMHLTKTREFTVRPWLINEGFFVSSKQGQQPINETNRDRLVSAEPIDLLPGAGLPPNLGSR